MKDQVAVVTGGAQGIGFAVVKKLLDNGIRVARWDLDPTNDTAMAGCGDQAVGG